ncbi:unnamed protein product [Closterium sp. NIES-65]|nr:unnamed protein product [Closterium sp. NIES-65]
MDYEVPLLGAHQTSRDEEHEQQQQQELDARQQSLSPSDLDSSRAAAAYSRPGDSAAAFGGDWRGKLAAVGQRVRASSAELGKRVTEAATAVGSRLEEQVSVVGERVKDLVLPTTQADILVDRATAEELLAPHWSTVLQISHLLQNGHVPGGDVARALRRRLATRDSHVQLLALAVAESVVGSAPQILGDIAREGVLGDMARMAVEPKTQARVRENVLRLIEAWAAPMEATRYFPAFEETFRELKEKGVTFPVVTAPPQRIPRLLPFESVLGDSYRGAGRIHITRPPSELPNQHREVVAMPADFLTGPNAQGRRTTPHVRFVMPGGGGGTAGAAGAAAGAAGAAAGAAAGGRNDHAHRQHHHHHHHNHHQRQREGAEEAAWMGAGEAEADPKTTFAMARNAADLLTTMLTSAPATEALKRLQRLLLQMQCCQMTFSLLYHSPHASAHLDLLTLLFVLLPLPLASLPPSLSLSLTLLADDSLLFDGLSVADNQDTDSHHLLLFPSPPRLPFHISLASLPFPLLPTQDEAVVSLAAQCRAAKRSLQRLLQQETVLADDSLLFDGLSAVDDVDAALARLAAMRDEVKGAQGKKQHRRGKGRGRSGGESAAESGDGTGKVAEWVIGCGGEGVGGGSEGGLVGTIEEGEDEGYESGEEEEEEEEGEALERGRRRSLEGDGEGRASSGDGEGRGTQEEGNTVKVGGVKEGDSSFGGEGGVVEVGGAIGAVTGADAVEGRVADEMRPGGVATGDSAASPAGEGGLAEKTEGSGEVYF